MISKTLASAVGVGQSAGTVLCWAVAGILFAALIYSVTKGSKS